MNMKAMTLSQAAAAVGGKLIGSGEDTVIERVVMDSRLDVTGSLFVAIVGNRVDGHDFAAEVLSRGAVCALVEREIDTAKPYILVDSTLRAIRDLAAYYRSLFDIPVIGITGSVGKTSTKEMLYSVLSTKYTVHKTEGNLNNEIGVPMTLFELRDTHEAAVIEMGISDFGEMTRLTNMVRPTIAMITIIGYAHLDNLGDRVGVFHAKTEIFHGLAPGGIALVNGDDDMLAPMHLTDIAPDKTDAAKITYGLNDNNAYRVTDIVNHGKSGMSCTLLWRDVRLPVDIHAFGQPMVLAALAAAAVGDQLGLTPEEIARGIGAFSNVAGRAQVCKTEQFTIIDDCYNASPNSVTAAITSLAQLPGRRIAILGDMAELGADTAALHRQVGIHAAQSLIDGVVCIGQLSKHTYMGITETSPTIAAWHFPEKVAAIGALQDILQSGDQILVKASRSMHFEEIVAALK